MRDPEIGAFLLSEFIYACSMFAFYVPGRWAWKRGRKKLSAWLTGMFYVCGGAGVGYMMASVDLLGGILALVAFGSMNGVPEYLNREQERMVGVLEEKRRML